MRKLSTTSIHPRRLRAVAYLRFGSVEALFRRLPICSRAVSYQVHRGAVSRKLEQALIEQLGADLWRFVLGESSALIDEEKHAEP